MYSVVDLFAGAGGLSLGFMQTGMFDIKAAFENSPYMQDTYKLNHPGVDVMDDVCDADYAVIRQKYGEIDVVIGGPPCQGFSNANRQKSTAVSKNNMLVKQYIRAILSLRPKAFIMENVSTLKSETHRFYMEHSDVETVEQCGITLKKTPMFLLHKDFVFSGALALVKDRKQLEALRWTEADYFQLNVIYKATKSTSKLDKALAKHRERLKAIAKRFSDPNATDHIYTQARKAFEAIECYIDQTIDAEGLRTAIEPTIMIQRMISRALEIYENDIIVDSYSEEDGIVANTKSFAVSDYLKGVLGADENGYTLKSQVLCAADYGAPQKRMRFIVMGVRRSIADDFAFPEPVFKPEQYRTVHDAIADLEEVKPVYDLSEDEGIKLGEVAQISELGKQLRDTAVLHNHIATKTTPVAMARFKEIQQGQNFHSLAPEMKTNTYTDADRTQNTIYLRLNYDEPSGTVVNVRKSMWIHPRKDRAISIREAARLQTFPDSFVFCGSKDKQYQQVGNAVPPIMARAIAEKVLEILIGVSVQGEDHG